MAKKPTVTTITTGYSSSDTLNENFEALRDGFDNTLSLDGSTPNAMEADLDLNGNNIVGADGLLINGTDYLADVTDGALPTSADANVDFSSVNGKANLFFSADQTANPFVGAWRQMPEVDYEYNKDFQRDEFVTTARYGVKLYRPENMVRVVSKTNV